MPACFEAILTHTVLVLNNPSTYEILNPSDFGLSRYVHFASRLTGWNAIKSRCEQLGLHMTDAEYKQCTAKVKALADIRRLTLDDTDAIIRNFHKSIATGTDVPLVDDLTQGEKRMLDEEERVLDMAADKKRKLDSVAAGLPVDAANGL